MIYGTKKNELGPAAVIFAVLLGVGLSIIMVLVNGFVVAQLWEWFVMDTFNLPKLGFVTAAGISVLVTYITYHGKSKDDDNDSLETALTFILRPVLALALGYILYSL